MLYPYTRDGVYARYFEGPSNVDMENPFVVLELGELDRTPDLRLVVLLLLMTRITEEMYLSERTQRKLAIIDEAWKLMTGNAAQFIEEGYRTARKFGGAFVTVTQGLADFYKSPTTTAALTNADWVFARREPPARPAFGHHRAGQLRGNRRDGTRWGGRRPLHRRPVHSQALFHQGRGLRRHRGHDAQRAAPRGGRRNPAEEGGMKPLHVLLIAGITAAAVQILFLLARPQQTVPEIVTVDFERLAQARAEHVNQTRTNMDQATLLADAKAYGERISNVLRTMANEAHLVILPRNAVAAGTRDITDRVLQRLEAAP